MANFSLTMVIGSKTYLVVNLLLLIHLIIIPYILVKIKEPVKDSI